MWSRSSNSGVIQIRNKTTTLPRVNQPQRETLFGETVKEDKRESLEFSSDMPTAEDKLLEVSGIAEPTVDLDKIETTADLETVLPGLPNTEKESSLPGLSVENTDNTESSPTGDLVETGPEKIGPPAQYKDASGKDTLATTDTPIQAPAVAETPKDYSTSVAVAEKPSAGGSHDHDHNHDHGPATAESSPPPTSSDPELAAEPINADQKAPGHSGPETTDTGGAQRTGRDKTTEVAVDKHTVPGCFFYTDQTANLANTLFKKVYDMIHDQCQVTMDFRAIKIKEPGSAAEAHQEVLEKCNVADYLDYRGYQGGNRRGQAVILTGNTALPAEACQQHLKNDIKFCPMWGFDPGESLKMRTRETFGEVAHAPANSAAVQILSPGALNEAYLMQAIFGFGVMGLGHGNSLGFGMGDGMETAADGVSDPTGNMQWSTEACDRIRLAAVDQSKLPESKQMPYRRKDLLINPSANPLGLEEMPLVFGEPRAPDVDTGGGGAGGNATPTESYAVTGDSRTADPADRLSNPANTRNRAFASRVNRSSSSRGATNNNNPNVLAGAGSGGKHKRGPASTTNSAPPSAVSLRDGRRSGSAYGESGGSDRANPNANEGNSLRDNLNYTRPRSF